MASAAPTEARLNTYEAHWKATHAARRWHALLQRLRTLNFLGATPPVSSRVAPTLQAYQRSTAWPHSGQPMHAHLKSLADPRLLRWNAASRRKATNDVTCLVRVMNNPLCMSYMFSCFFLFNYVFSYFVGNIDSGLCPDAEYSLSKPPVDHTTANSSVSMLPTGSFPVAFSEPPIGNMQDIGETGSDKEKCARAEALQTTMFVLWGVFAVLFFGFLYIGHKTYDSIIAGEFWCFKDRYSYKQHEAVFCNREHEQHVQLLHLLYLSDHLCKQIQGGGGRVGPDAVWNEQVVFSMSVVMGTRAREEGEKSEETVWLTLNSSGVVAQEASTSEMRERAQAVAWLGVRSDGSALERIELKTYDRELCWE